jgi:hypothetical protein
MPNSAIDTSFDPNMDFDFDNIDFSGLDLGMVDDMNFDTGFDAQMGNEEYNVAAAAPFSSSMQGEGLYNSFDPSLAFNLNNSMALSEQQQQLLNQDHDITAEEDLNELTPYMTGFKA